MNITNIDFLTLKKIRDKMQTHLTYLLKRQDLVLEQRLQIEGHKKDQKTCWEEIFCLASDATCKQMKYWLQPIEFERFQLLPTCWRTNQPFPFFGWVLKGRREKRDKNGVWTSFSCKMIPWPNFRLTLPLIPEREHFLNSLWWTDCAMNIYL